MVTILGVLSLLNDPDTWTVCRSSVRERGAACFRDSFSVSPLALACKSVLWKSFIGSRFSFVAPSCRL